MAEIRRILCPVDLSVIYKTILCPIEFSDPSTRALEYALTLRG